MRALVLCTLAFVSTGCIRDASDALSLAPSSPYASWTPMEGNKLISSKYCQTLLPPEFSSNALSLSELLDVALQNNPTTKQTWARARSAAAEYGESLSGFYPNVQFSGFYYRQKAGFPTTGIPTATPGSPTTISAGGLSRGVQESYFTEAGPDVILSYTLFDFGQQTAASMAAREALYYADLHHNRQIQCVVQVVMSGYYRYLAESALMEAREADVQNAKLSLDAATSRFDLGLAALGEVAQARTQYLQNKIALTNQKQTLERAFAQLAVDLGLPPNVPFTMQKMPDEIAADAMLENVDALVALAQTTRQDFLAAQADLRSKEASLLQAKRAYYPTINSQLASGQYWFQNGLSEPSPHWTAAISLTFPIFTGFAQRNQLKAAKAQVELASAIALQTELSLIQEVTVSYAAVKTAASNLTDSKEYVKSAEQQFQIALTGYKAGTSTLLDLVQAQTALSDARSQKVGAQKDWFLSLATLAYSTGSLCYMP